MTTGKHLEPPAPTFRPAEWGLPSGLRTASYGSRDGLYRVVVELDTESVPVAGGRYAIPREFYFCSDEPSQPRVRLMLALEGGELVCSQALVLRRPGEQSLASLRRVKIPALLKIAGPLAAVAPEDVLPVGLLGQDATQEFIAALSADAPPTPRRGKLLPPGHLKEVARIYKEALMTGQPPTLTVAEAMQTTRANAGFWVWQARDKGYLGKTTKGKAGEIAPPKKRRKA